MRKNKLSNMEIDSVDLCKKGANQKAHIKLYKSAPEGENDMEQITKSVGAAQVRETTGVRPDGRLGSVCGQGGRPRRRPRGL